MINDQIFYEVCANCGQPYHAHDAANRCGPNGETGWFPKAIAEAISRMKTAEETDVLDEGRND